MSNTPIHTTNLTENAHQGIYDVGAHESAVTSHDGCCPFTTKQPAAVIDSSTLLTPRQTAGLLSISLSTLYRMVERRDLAALRVSRTLRFAPADIAAYLEARRTAPKS